MFLHLGNDVEVLIKHVIAILDFEKTTISKITREFLKTAQEEEFIINVSPNDLPKSFIITEEYHGSRVYISPIAASTLQKRLLGSQNMRGILV